MLFKKINPLKLFTLFVLLMIPCYFIFLLFDNKDSKADEQKSTQPTTKAFAYTEDQTETTREMSMYPGLHLYSELSESEDYTVSITYPLTGIETIDLPIQSWADEQKELFLEEVKANKNTNTFPSHLNIQVTTNEIEHGVYNIVLHAEHYNGGANGMTYLASFTFDIEQSTHIALHNLFNVTIEDTFFDHITSEIQKEIENNTSYAEFIFDELLDERLKDMDEWKWGISSDSFNLYFDKYEIGPGSLGAITISIPLDRLRLLLKDQWKDTFNVTEVPIIDQSIEEDFSQSTEEPDDPAKLENYDKYIALTFDDGPQPQVTPRILETLAEYDAVATFFMLGIQVEYYPEIASLVVDQGHEVGGHSMSHLDYTLLTKDGIEKDILASNQIIEHTTGEKPLLFRPPFGAYDADVQEVAEEHGLSLILWSVDSLDWKTRNAELVYATIMDDIEVGSNVLMHDIHPTTADALPELLETLTNEGYQFVTVSELLELQEKIDPGPF